MVDAFVDRMKGWRRVPNEAAAVRVGDVFFDGEGTKWLCVGREPHYNGWALDFDDVEPVNFSKFLKRLVVNLLIAGSFVLPAIWLWRNS